VGLTILDLRVTAGKIIKRFCTRLRTIDGKGQVVVLEVETHAREIHDWFDADLAKLFWVAFSPVSTLNKRLTL